jgi:hypothetical protein
LLDALGPFFATPHPLEIASKARGRVKPGVEVVVIVDVVGLVVGDLEKSPLRRVRFSGIEATGGRIVANTGGNIPRSA